MTDCRPEIVGALTVCEMRRVYCCSDLNYATEEDKKGRRRETGGAELGIFQSLRALRFERNAHLSAFGGKLRATASPPARFPLSELPLFTLCWLYSMIQ